VVDLNQPDSVATLLAEDGLRFDPSAHRAQPYVLATWDGSDSDFSASEDEVSTSKASASAGENGAGAETSALPSGPKPLLQVLKEHARQIQEETAERTLLEHYSAPAQASPRVSYVPLAEQLRRNALHPRPATAQRAQHTAAKALSDPGDPSAQTSQDQSRLQHNGCAALAAYDDSESTGSSEGGTSAYAAAQDRAMSAAQTGGAQRGAAG